jgi:hypothetical protein
MSHPAAWIICCLIVTVSLFRESLDALGQKLESARPFRQTAIMLQHLHAKQDVERLRGTRLIIEQPAEVSKDPL